MVGELYEERCNNYRFYNCSRNYRFSLFWLKISDPVVMGKNIIKFGNVMVIIFVLTVMQENFRNPLPEKISIDGNSYELEFTNDGFAVGISSNYTEDG